MADGLVDNSGGGDSQIESCHIFAKTQRSRVVVFRAAVLLTRGGSHDLDPRADVDTTLLFLREPID